MAVYYEIPIDDTEYYSEYFIDLSGTTFKLRFMYNAREGRWAMSIFSSDGVLLKSNIKLRVNLPLTGRFRYDDRMPAGEFFLINMYDSNEEPTFENIEDKCKLFYVEGFYE